MKKAATSQWLKGGLFLKHERHQKKFVKSKEVIVLSVFFRAEGRSGTILKEHKLFYGY